MKIEIFTNAMPMPGMWYWHFKSKGRIVADSEGFPTKANAVRAAKACVRAVRGKECIQQYGLYFALSGKGTKFTLTWA